MPALFTRMSMRRWRLMISSAARATACWSATSSAIASSPGCARVFSLRPEMTTVAPASFSACAPARPMPEPPPVIQATLSFSVLGSAKQVLFLFFGHLAGTARVLQHLERALHRGALEERIAPLLQRRKLVDVYALALGKAQPRHGGHIGDGVLVARQIFALTQSSIDHSVESIRLVPVPVHGVLDLLRRVAEEVVRLPEYRADVAHLEHGPLHHLPALAQVLRQETAGLGRQVEQHRARLGERERLAVRALGIDHRRHLVVRRDLEELGLELVTLADVDRDHAVGRAGFLEHDVDLVAVRRWPRVQVNH